LGVEAIFRISETVKGENDKKNHRINIRVRPQASISGPCQTLAHYISETFILIPEGKARKREKSGRQGRRKFALSYKQQLIDLRRYAGIFRSD